VSSRTDFGRNYFAKLAGMGSKDTETRIIIPTKVRQFMTAGAMAALANTITEETLDTVLKDVVERIIGSGFLTLSVTEIKIRGEHVMPKSKGIGSIGEIIHVMGTRNEAITLNFTTDLFPGAFSGIFKYIIQATLQSADVVYVIDDLLIASSCLLKTYELSKVGRLKSAIIGSLVLEVLPVDTFGLGSGNLSFVTAARQALTSNAINNLATAIPINMRWLLDYLRS